MSAEYMTALAASLDQLRSAEWMLHAEKLPEDASQVLANAAGLLRLHEAAMARAHDSIRAQGDFIECMGRAIRAAGCEFDEATGAVVNTRGPQWLPIESAPKDGTEILVWDGVGQATVSWEAGGWSLIYCGWYAYDGDFHGATHWQPLPAAPEVE